jgi:internalin A
MVELKYLDINNNKIKSIDAIRNFTKLNYLNIYKNEIASISVVKNFIFLNEYDFRYNQINFFDAVQELIKNKSILDLRFNNIGWFNNSVLCSPRIKFIYLMNNRLRIIKSYSFINVPNTIFINLDDNIIQQIEPFGLSELNKLEFLSLRNNLIKFLYRDLFSGFNLIENLIFINNNKVSTIEFNAFNNASGLSMDYLSLVNLKEFSSDYFCKF